MLEFGSVELHVLLAASTLAPGSNGYGWADLIAGSYYDIRVIYSNGYGAAYIRLWWRYTGVSDQIIPSSSLYYPERVGGNVKTVIV